MRGGVDDIVIKVKLREIRTERELSLDELSGICGLSVSELNRIEHNRANPRLSTIERICIALNVQPGEILFL